MVFYDKSHIMPIQIHFAERSGADLSILWNITKTVLGLSLYFCRNSPSLIFRAYRPFPPESEFS